MAGTNTGKTKLELTWIGKDIRPRLEPRILIEDPEFSHHAETRREGDIFDNVLIHGDNLLALKALETDPNVRGKVKCVFIDPPYNTGSAFAEYDDGLEHSLWLATMRDRLDIIHNLLGIDGSLWVTVDDNEAHYLKVALDEIFGRKNFIANAIWQKKLSRANDARFFSDNHDHILVYAKSRSDFELNLLPRSEDQNSGYANPDGDPRGAWSSQPIQVKTPSAAGLYEITTPAGLRFNPPPGRSWGFSHAKYEELVKDNRIWFGRDGKNVPRVKKFITEVQQGITPVTIWPGSEVGHNQEAKKEVKDLFPGLSFDTPKPERLLHRVITLATNPGDLVLDSFAGSGTTGAVAHKMGRRWIMVELGEHAKTHIVPRMNKVIDGQDKGGVTEAANWKGGGGYRFFRLAPSLLEKDQWGNWVIAKAYNPAMLSEAMCKHFGFTYAPSSEHYWMHGQSAETSFIYVTTNSLTFDQLRAISDEVGENRSLLICCTAYDSGAEKLANLAVKKIPQAVLSSCEWGKDDYSLKIESLPMMAEDEEEDIPTAKPASKGKRDKDTGDLFAGDSHGDQA